MYHKTLFASIVAMAFVSGYGLNSTGQNSNAVAADSTKANPAKVYSFKMNTLAGEPVDMTKYAGKVVMFVNVASKCGMTPQYSALQKLYESHKDKGLVIVGVPCNQFGSQEAGTSKEIQAFCSSKYNVSFDMLEKVNVKNVGDQKACELFAFLSAQDSKPLGSGDVKWNFEKFILDRKGNLVGRFGSSVAPDSKEVVALLEKALAE